MVCMKFDANTIYIKLVSTPKIPGHVFIMSNEDCYFYVLFMLLHTDQLFVAFNSDPH